MKRIPLLHPHHIVVPLRASSLPAALDILIDLLEQSGSLRDRAALDEGLATNRERATVVIAPDVVLPHFRTDAVTSLVVALGVTPEPVKLDAEQVRVIAFVLAPTDATTAYLRAVSALARTFRHEEVIAKLLAARSGADVLDIPELASLAVQPHLVVGDVMVRDVAPISPDTTVRDVVARFARTGLPALPVVGAKGEVLGIVSEADVLAGMLHGGSRGLESGAHGLVPPLAVRDVMTRSVMCIAETTDLEEAARLMVSKELELFPVVTGGRLSGLISRGDILRQLYGR